MTAGTAAIARSTMTPFARLWLARLVSSAGTEITAVALPLVSVVTLGAGPLLVSLLTAAGYLPSLVFGLAAGSLADRFDRRRLLIVADLGRATALLIVPLAAAGGWLSAPALVVVAFLVGTGTVVFDVAVQALTPSLVGADALVHGNARLQLAEQSVGLVGPAAGGALVAMVGAPVAVLADAASYVVSAGLVATIPRAVAAAGSSPAVSTADGGALDGLRFVVRHPLLRATAASSFLINLGSRAIEGLLIVALVRIGGLGPTGVGLVLSGGAIGFVIGSLVADRVTARVGLGRSITAALGVIVVTFFAMALAPAAAFGLVVALAFAIYGVAAVVSTVGGLSLRQAVTPAPLLGRVGAAVRTFVYAAFPTGAVGGGVVATLLDLRAALVIAALVSSSGFLVVLLSPVRSVRSLASLSGASEPAGARPAGEPVSR